MTETVFRNGRIVLPDEVIAGDVVVRGGDDRGRSTIPALASPASISTATG